MTNICTDTQLSKILLDRASPDFAWQVMQLQITLQQSQKPPLPQLMRLIQLYMVGVEVLENEDDKRFNYFNNKIHSLMMHKNVVQQLHRAATGVLPDPETLEMVQRRELENRKGQIELQVFLQKDLYTLSAIKDIIRREEGHHNRREQKIRNHLIGQNVALQERITTRRLRSSSGSKGQKEESTVNSLRIISKGTYATKYKNGEQENAPNKIQRKKELNQ